MKIELTNYAKGMDVKKDVLTWLNKRVFNNDKIKYTQTELEHIIDYLASNKRPKRLEKATYKQMFNNAKKWSEALQKKGKDIKEKNKIDYETVKKYKNGFKIVKLISKQAYDREGMLMRHCISSYYGQDDEIYSLRDKDNQPHATMSKNSQQIKGKGNGSIHPKYVKYIVDWLDEIGIEVRDNEMRNLGYVNINNIDVKYSELSKETQKQLFNSKYWNKDNTKLLNKKDKEIFKLLFWNEINLLDNDCKILWDLHKDLNNVNIEPINNKNTNNGYYAQIGSSGNSARIGSSGYSARIGSSGYYARIGSSGYYAQIGSSGNSAQIGISGDFAQIGSSGNYARIGSSGYYARIGSSGYYARIGSSGNSAKIDVKGKNSVCADVGYQGKIKGVKGTWICLTEWRKDENNNYYPYYMKSAQIDGKKLKENVFYKLENKKFVEVEE